MRFELTFERRLQKASGGVTPFHSQTASEMPRAIRKTSKPDASSKKRERAPPKERRTPPAKKTKTAVPAVPASLGQDDSEELEENGDGDAAGSDTVSDKDMAAGQAAGASSSSSSSSDEADDDEDGGFGDKAPPVADSDGESDEDDTPRRQPVAMPRATPRVRQTARMQTGTDRLRKGPPAAIYQNSQHQHHAAGTALPRPSANITGVTHGLDVQKCFTELMATVKELSSSVILLKSDIKKNHREVDARLDKMNAKADSNERRISALASGSTEHIPQNVRDAMPVSPVWATFWDKDRKNAGMCLSCSVIFSLKFVH